MFYVDTSMYKRIFGQLEEKYELMFQTEFIKHRSMIVLNAKGDVYQYSRDNA